MKDETPPKNDLTNVPDATLFEETATRLRRVYRKGHGIEFLYGCFEFIFHEGRFQGVEERPRFRFYRSQPALAGI